MQSIEVIQKTPNRDDFIELHNGGVRHEKIIVCKTDRNY